MEQELLDRFDRLIEADKLATRSEAIRQLVWEKLTAVAWTADASDVAASLTLIFDHHKTKLTDKMLEVQHQHSHRVVATMHVHLDHDLCMEMIALRGPAVELQKLAAELSGLKGIHKAQLVIVRAEPNDHSHSHQHPHPSGHSHE
jgi:CopG family nickel-responsive transcriptional regulator